MPATAVSGPSDPEEHRVILACDLCRARKRKCDGVRPICNRCSLTKKACTYSVRAQERRAPSETYDSARKPPVRTLRRLLRAASLEDPPVDFGIHPSADNEPKSIRSDAKNPRPVKVLSHRAEVEYLSDSGASATALADIGKQRLDAGGTNKWTDEATKFTYFGATSSRLVKRDLDVASAWPSSEDLDTMLGAPPPFRPRSGKSPQTKTESDLRIYPPGELSRILARSPTSAKEPGFGEPSPTLAEAGLGSGLPKYPFVIDDRGLASTHYPDSSDRKRLIRHSYPQTSTSGSEFFEQANLLASPSNRGWRHESALVLETLGPFSAVPNQAPGLWSSDSKGKKSTSYSSVKRRRRRSLESWTDDSNEEDSNNDDAPTVCTNCQATSPVPLWRRDPGGRPLCRECGLYHELHGISRPASPKRDAIEQRPGSAHTTSAFAPYRRFSFSSNTLGQMRPYSTASQSKTPVEGGPINDEVSSSMRPGHTQRVFVNVTSPSVASISDRLKAMDFSNDLKNMACNILSQGSAADVWLYQERGEPPASVHTPKVVKKVMRVAPNYFTNIVTDQGKDLLTQFREDFGNRFRVWMSLQHFNIVCVPHVEEVSLTLYEEHCAGGNLRQYAKRGISNSTCNRIMRGVLRALVYLHGRNPPIVHGSVTSEKIYISDSGDAKLGGFGLSRLASQFPHLVPSISMDGIVRWMSPEYLESESEEDVPTMTVGLDIWSFGCTWAEVITGCLPYHEYKYDVQVISKIMGGEPPSQLEEALRFTGDPQKKFSSSYARRVWKLIEECWKPVKERPSAMALQGKARISVECCRELLTLLQ